MMNLAGHKYANDYVREELTRARIPIVEGELGRGEVPTSLTGSLGPFRLWRAWTYWVVTGPVPLEVAREIFADVVGATDVRAAGHCGCLSPDQQITWLTDIGSIVIPVADYVRCVQLLGHGRVAELARLGCDTPADIAKPYVTGYHIDTEVGLRVFVDAVRRHRLEDAPRPSWWRCYL